MKLLTAMPEPKGLLPPANLRTINIVQRWFTTQNGAVFYSFKIEDGDWSLPERVNRKPFVEISCESS